MIALELDAEQRSAAEAPFGGCFAILGGAVSGKTTALAERVAHARASNPSADPLVISSPHELDEFAVALLRSAGASVTLVDDVDAEAIFAEAVVPLLELQWDEFSQDQLDPEIPGLRSPARFLQSAFRLIRRLRDAGIEPGTLLSRSLTAATEFYANPPNFADPRLLYSTKAAYHDSLDVTPAELERQYRREIDLAKILAKVYAHYVELVETGGRMTGRDAAIAAAKLLRGNPALAERVRERHAYAFVDDAQELSPSQMALLSALFGEQLAGVTLCGDPSSALSPVRVTNPQATFARAQTRVELPARNPKPPRAVERARSADDEAALIADRIASWISGGCPPERIAVIFRSVRSVQAYESALLARDIPVVVSGDANVFADRRSLDALALLWNVHDPFRHDWLLRTLGNPAVGLSDASLAALCAEPPSPQRALFAFDEEQAPTIRPSRWDPKRDLRLGWNVIRGEQDDALSADAAARLRRFRALREGWLDAMDSTPFEEFVRHVWREGLAREGAPGGARARAQQIVLRRLLARLSEYADECSEATLGDVLAYAERRADSDLEGCTGDGEPEGFVRMLSVEAARGHTYDRVIVAGARPGVFPLWYAPESFMFSLRFGMVPKENVGEAKASRTAKFSYYIVRTKAAQHYYERERRAFAYALSRARVGVLVTASGAPTRGVTAPEFLEELR